MRVAVLSVILVGLVINGKMMIELSIHKQLKNTRSTKVL